MRSRKGFSLIELLIVVAIILIIATISIPYLLRAKQSANESAAIANVRTINSGEATYNTLYPNLGFADLKTLGPNGNTCTPGTSTGACILDSALGCSGGTSGAFCRKDAYEFTITINSSGASYVVFTTPLAANLGVKDFCSTADQVIRSQSQPAAPNSSPVTTEAGCTVYSAL